MFPVTVTADIGNKFMEEELDPIDQNLYRFLMRDLQSNSPEGNPV